MATPVRLVTSKAAGSGPIGAASVWYMVAQGGIGDRGAEIDAKITYRTAGTFSHMTVNKTIGTMTTMVLTFRVAGGNGNQSITLTNTNGQYEDTTNTDTIAAGTTIDYQLTNTGSGTGTTLTTLGVLWQAQSTTTNILCRSNFGGPTDYTTASETSYFFPVNDAGGKTTTQANAEWLVKLPNGVDHVTIRNLYVRASANTSTNAITVSIEGASGSGTRPSVSIAGSSGAVIVEDTSNSIQVKDGDKIRGQVVTGSGTVSLQLSDVAFEVQSDNDVWHYVMGGASSSAGANPTYWPISGFGSSSSTETNVQAKHGIANTILSLLSVFVVSAGGTDIRLRQDVADATYPSQLAVSTAGTGWTTDSTNKYYPDPSDLLNFKSAGSASLPTITCLALTVQGNQFRLPNEYQNVNTVGAGGWVPERGFRL